MSETDPSQVRLSVIVPTCNRAASLTHCLVGLGTQTLLASQFEIIVVDDSGTPADDDSPTTMGDIENLRLLRHPQNLGAAAARNTGARAASSPNLAFLDDDCVPEPEWAAEILDLLAGSDGAALAGTVVIAKPEPSTDRVTQLLSAPMITEDGSIARAQSANLAVPAEGYQAIEGFDESYRGAAYEDYDFCLRWRQSGRTILPAPTAVVHHEHHTNLGGFWRQHYRYGRGAAVFYGQGPDGPRVPLLSDLRRMIATIQAGRTLAEKLSHLGLVGLSQIATLAGFTAKRLSRS